MSGTRKVLGALLLGAAAGAVVGMLFAPEKGSNTRKKIQSKAQDLIDELSRKINESKETLSDLKDKATGVANDLKDKATSKAQQMGAAAEEEFNGRNKARNSSSY